MLSYASLLFIFSEVYKILFCLIVLVAITGTKLCEDSRRYGSGNTCTTSGNTLTRASLSFANARDQMEKERGTLLKALGTQVSLETN